MYVLWILGKSAYLPVAGWSSGVQVRHFWTETGWVGDDSNSLNFYCYIVSGIYYSNSPQTNQALDPRNAGTRST